MPARVLLLENDSATRELICYLLDRYRHDAIAVDTPELAMSVLRRETPDMILSDLQLGRPMDGYAFGTWCRTQAELATIPLVCITASWNKYRPDKIQTVGFTALIPKPINPEAFVNQLEFYLPSDKWGTPPDIPE
jgi:two-component system, cell cycle response regulator DivK